MARKRHPERAVQSMTGYAMVSSPGEIQLAVELRGVNGRFLDLVMRLPDEMRPAEPALREILRANVQRGKVECRVTWRHEATLSNPLPDPLVLDQLRQRLQALQHAVPEIAPPSASELLTYPGLFNQPPDQAQLQERVTDLAGQAVQAFIQSRETEGKHLRKVLDERLQAIDAIAVLLRDRVPELTAAFEQRLTERLETALSNAPGAASIPPEETMARVRQEVSNYGLRADVTEELDRLQTHVTQCRKLLGGPGPVGKRLDFLMQELNREANTLGSKASAIDLTQAAVDLKVLIEQIREQVQNLE